MALKLETFSNADLKGGWRPGNNAGGHSLFKALGHPMAARLGQALFEACLNDGPIAIYDPRGVAIAFDALFGISRCGIEGIFVQRVEDQGTDILGHRARLVNELPRSAAKTLLVLSFDAARLTGQLQPLLPKGMAVRSLDEMRISPDMLTNPGNYTDPLNFATNFALFRDIAGKDAGSGLHTTLTTANYWGLHGAENPGLWLCLFDAHGNVLAEWNETLPQTGALIRIDSRAVRERFRLGDFCGSLFMHAVRLAGHDIVKYALDIHGEGGRALSCSHDANAWPADFYAGMPAPHNGESLILHIQNSHPAPIPAGAIGLGLMGGDAVSRLDVEIAPFATYSLDVAQLLPQARWPDQIEIHAGKYFVRPRYETVLKDGRRRMAHANVERTDLKPDPDIPGLAASMGKAYLMPLPVPPLTQFSSLMLPAPMATGQTELPLRAELYDASGEKVAAHFMGRLQRRDSVPLIIDDWLKQSGAKLASGFGHVEFLYDFRDGGEADGWLHALGKFTLRASGHAAETIFGAHIYNVPVIYKDEPQSYTNAPPGLTTRLFLRLGQNLGVKMDALCHLIYPASLPWHEKSSTQIILHDGAGQVVTQKQAAIACSGSLFWRYSEMFDAGERKAAGADAYIIVRDTSCRLFGFHGLMQGKTSFSLDHMFGF
ncbi:MAG: hypothetical protein Dbin4_02517 [Alphaproteobacteria bacterium]|nr:hypothetical protein [Alphaproteobacteria bacterium]